MVGVAVVIRPPCPADPAVKPAPWRNLGARPGGAAVHVVSPPRGARITGPHERRPRPQPEAPPLGYWALCSAPRPLGACAGPSTERSLAPSSPPTPRPAGCRGGGPGGRRGRRDPSPAIALLGRAAHPSNRRSPTATAVVVPRPSGQVKKDASEQSEVTQFIPLVATRADRERRVQDVVPARAPRDLPVAHEDRSASILPLRRRGGEVPLLDRGTFLLFPLWLRTERNGRTTTTSSGPSSPTPADGRDSLAPGPSSATSAGTGATTAGSSSGPSSTGSATTQYGDQERSSWMFWPWAARRAAGGHEHLRALARVRIRPRRALRRRRAMAPGGLPGRRPDRATRKRVWPFYSSYEGDGMTSVGRVAAGQLAPRGVRRRDQGDVQGLPPVAQLHPGSGRVTPQSTGPPGRSATESLALRTGPDGPEQSDLHVVDLNPFPDYEFVDEHYAWLWELYTRERPGGGPQPAWLGYGGARRTPTRTAAP